MVVEPKTAQPIELDEELVNLFSSTDRKVQKPSLSSRMVIQPVKVEPQPIEVRLRSNGHLPSIKC